MAKTPKEYQRISGRGMRVEGGGLISASRTYCTIWLGRDHLLLVDRVGYTETYKRFYFRDIQAIIIRKTVWATVGTLTLAFFALLFLILTLAVSDSVAKWILGVVGGLFAFFTLLNLWFGPSCLTHIKTAVQTEQLPSWKRVKTARKALAKIRPFLIEAQGDVPLETLRSELEARYLQRSPGWEPTQ